MTKFHNEKFREDVEKLLEAILTLENVDECHKFFEDICTIKEGIATYTMASDMYSVPGELTVRLAVVEDASVLTDREIVFEVIGNAVSVDKAQTVVPINDSVILRLSALEQKLAQKVDKADGMGLSANDFTDEYRQKLDGLDDTIGKEVERVSEVVDNLSDILESHAEETEGMAEQLRNLADELGSFKEETDADLNSKASTEDVENIENQLGDISAALDGIIEIQNQLKGGE